MNFDNYIVTGSCPVKDDFTVYKLYKFPNPNEILRVQGFENFWNEINGNFEELRGCGTFRDLLECGVKHNYYVIKFVDEESFEKVAIEYENKIDDCGVRFKEDLFKKFNLDEENGEKLFEISLDFDSSYEGIYSFFEKIVNVIEDIKQ